MFQPFTHLYHAVNYWGNEVMQFTQLKWSSVVIIFSCAGCQQINPYPEHLKWLVSHKHIQLQTQGNLPST